MRIFYITVFEMASPECLLTFGEACVLAAELRRRRRASPATAATCDVFLGGSCGDTTWRADVAVPWLRRAGLSYFNPQVATWRPELMAAEHLAKQRAGALLFVVDGETRCAAGMLEVYSILRYTFSVLKFIAIDEKLFRNNQNLTLLQ